MKMKLFLCGWNNILARPLCLAAGGLLLAGAGDLARGQAITFSNIWNIPVNSRSYMTTTNTERGIAVSPVTGHVLLASRSTGNFVYVLDGETGAELGQLSTSGITGGTLHLVHLLVAEDGAIYALNLSAAGSIGLKVYRWGDETPGVPPTVAFGPGLSTTVRYGDSADIRGSGPNTQIAVSGNGAANVAILTTTDGTNFTGVELPIGAPMTAGDFGKGLTFGAGDTLYGKNSGSVNVRHASFDLVGSTLSLVRTLTLDSSGVALDYDVGNELLAVVLSANNTTRADHRLKVYRITNPAAPVTLLDNQFPSPTFANGNLIGATDFGSDKLVALDPNNGVQAFRKTLTELLITPQPSGATVMEGGYFTLVSGAIGREPISLQWYFNGTDPVPGATAATLLLSNITPAQAGGYTLVASNTSGSQTSAVANILVTPAVLARGLVPLWQVPNGSRAYLQSDNNCRGMAYNPATSNVLVLSRTGSPKIYVLDGNTGADLRQLIIDTNVISGGTFALNLIGVSPAGRVYAGNLTLNGTTDPFKLYVWDSDSDTETPKLVWSGDPGNGAAQRWGDTLDVRTVGGADQVLLGSRFGSLACILAGFPDFPWDRNTLDTGAPGGTLGLGVAFGAGDTFWGTAAGTNLVHVGFDLNPIPPTATLLHNFGLAQFPQSVTTFGVDPENHLLAGVSLETPDNLRLYDLYHIVESAQSQPPRWLDTEFFPTDNANLNGTGAVDFGGGRVFALDSNNGLIAYEVPPVLRYARSGDNLTLLWTGSATLYAADEATAASGDWTEVVGAASGMTIDTSLAPRKFYQLRR